MPERRRSTRAPPSPRGSTCWHLRYVAVVLGCALTAVGGVVLFSNSGGFVSGLTNGRGFIALAVVVLARWNPFAVVAASLVVRRRAGTPVPVAESGTARTRSARHHDCPAIHRRDPRGHSGARVALPLGGRRSVPSEHEGHVMRTALPQPSAPDEKGGVHLTDHVGRRQSRYGSRRRRSCVDRNTSASWSRSA